MTNEVNSQKSTKPIWKKWWFWAIIGVAVFIIILAGGNEETKPNLSQPQVQQKITQKEKTAPSKVTNLSEEKRKEIFLEILQAEDKAFKEAQEKYPTPYYEHLQVGKKYKLSKETPLMPELEPTNPIAALGEVMYIPAGETIEILQVVIKQGTPWYYVNAQGIGEGWISSAALRGQFQEEEKQQLERQLAFYDLVITTHKKEIAKKYGITEEQLMQIIAEGVVKNWK